MHADSISYDDSHLFTMRGIWGGLRRITSTARRKVLSLINEANAPKVEGGEDALAGARGDEDVAEEKGEEDEGEDEGGAEKENGEDDEKEGDTLGAEGAAEEADGELVVEAEGEVVAEEKERTGAADAVADDGFDGSTVEMEENGFERGSAEYDSEIGTVKIQCLANVLRWTRGRWECT